MGRRVFMFLVGLNHYNISSGLPNTFGGYDETPEVTAKHLKVWGTSVNIF